MTATFPDELRVVLRHARRRPLFALAVVATLAVSIAAATTAFGVANSVLWRPLPFADATRLVFVWEAPESTDGRARPSRVTGFRYAAWRDGATSLSSVALFGAATLAIE